jgi:hypothetical protein
MFVYLRDDAPRRTLDQVQAELTAQGVACRVEHLADGPWLVLDGDRTDMSVTVDPDGTATSAMVQLGDDSPATLDRLFAAFNRLGWEVADE